MSTEVLEHQIKTGEFANVYILFGEEDYLKTHYCKKIVEKAVTGNECFNLQRFDGIPDLSALAAAVTNLPLFSPKKCVVLRDPDIGGMRANDWKELSSIVKEVPPECILLFHFDALRPNPKKDARFKSLLTLVKKSGLAVQIDAPAKRDILRFIAKRAKENGCRIEAPQAEYLLETCGEGLNNLLCETDKVCAFAGGGQIENGHIDAVAVRPVTSSIYDLARAVVGGRLDRAMGIIDELFYKKEEPVVILSALSGAFCDLYRAKAAACSGVSEAALVADFNYRGREFRARNALRDSRSLDLAFLKTSLCLLMRADAKIKSTRADKRMVLEELIVSISSARTHRGGRIF